MKPEIQSIAPNFRCTDSRILYFKRQLTLANEVLECQKEEFTKKMSIFDEREKKLREKDLGLQEIIVKCHELINDSEEIKMREIKRLSDERRRCEEIDQAISEVQKAIHDKNIEEKDLIALLDKNRRYKEYLENVVVDQAQDEESPASSEGSASGDDIQDILDRYYTLKSMNDSLLSKMDVNMKEHDTRRLRYAQFMKKSGNDILNMNNDVARLQKELELVTVMSDKLERLELGTYQNSNEVITDISQVLLVIDNMLEKLQCHAHPSLSSNSKPPTLTAMEGIEKKVRMASERLDIIADLINDYDSILANTTAPKAQSDDKYGNEK